MKSTPALLSRAVSSMPAVRHPTILEHGARQPGKTRKGRGAGAVSAGKRRNLLDERFRSHWSLLGGPELVPEYVALPPRKWRFDYAHVASRVLIELHGGIWTQGRHTQGAGFRNDREKMNAAQAAGWLVYELVEVKADVIEGLIAACRRNGGGK